MNNKIIKKEILFLAATHGNENFAISVLKRIDKQSNMIDYDWIIVNEEALKQNKRFVESDMNRIAPGNIKDINYENRRVAEVIKLSKKYKYTIDLHGTVANTGIFIIITNPTPQNIVLALSLPIKRIVFWISGDKNDPGAITKFVDCGLEIECGPKDSPDTADNLQSTLQDIIKSKLEIIQKSINSKEFFQVTGKLKKEDIETEEVGELREFQKVDISGESFYPLLIGRYDDRVCTKLKRLDFWELFSYKS